MLSSGAEESDDRVSVDRSIYNLVKDNVAISQTAFKMFSNIDWIIQNDFQLEKVHFRELYNFIRFVISRAREFCGIKQQSIIINDYNSYFDKIRVNINREYLDKAVFEILINALKFSRPQFLYYCPCKRGGSQCDGDRGE